MEDHLLYKDSFFKSLSIDDMDIIKSMQPHKYLRIEGKRYIYKEKEIDKNSFHDFMSDQLTRMKKFKTSLTRALGADLGDDIYHEWIALFSKQYRETWMKKHNLTDYVRT